MIVSTALVRIANRISGRFLGDRFGPRYDAHEMIQRLMARPSVGQDAQVRIIANRSHEAWSAEASRWIDAACEQVREMTRERFMVYGKPAPALRPGFPWAGRWQTGENDVLLDAFPHRFTFVPRLSLALLAERYSSKEFAALLRHWMRFASRHPRLPFISTFVVSQRVLASTCAFQLLTPRGGEAAANCVEPRLALLQIIEQDVAYLLPRIGSAYPNSHLLTERFLAWFIAAVHPAFARGKLKREDAEEQWLRELERQTYADGGSFEHSAYYHSVATEMALAYLLLKRKSGDVVPPESVHRIRNMLRLQADLAGADGNVPNFGDCAEDAMFPLDGGRGTTAAAMREIYRRLFAPSIPPLAHWHPAQERAFWLLEDDTRPCEAETRDVRLSANPKAGIFVFFDDDQNTRCTFRAGPAADTATIAGHMHSDLMSIYLVYRGAPVLADAGTYTYRFGADANGVPNWRAYFAGPHAHNGIVIDGADPLGTVTGDFRPGSSLAYVRHAHIVEGAHLSAVESCICAPDGYAGFTRGVIHVRGEYFLVYNVLGGSVHAAGAAYPLQFDRHVRVAHERDRAFDFQCGAARARFAYSDELTLGERRNGSLDPLGGWISASYGKLDPALQLVFHPHDGNANSAFALCINASAPVDRIASYRYGAEGLAFRVLGTDFCDHILLNRDVPSERAMQFGVEFDGRLLWLRRWGSGRTEIRALEVGRCRAAEFGVDLEFRPVQDEIRRVWEDEPSMHAGKGRNKPHDDKQ